MLQLIRLRNFIIYFCCFLSPLGYSLVPLLFVSILLHFLSLKHKIQCRFHTPHHEYKTTTGIKQKTIQLCQKISFPSDFLPDLLTHSETMKRGGWRKWWSLIEVTCGYRSVNFFSIWKLIIRSGKSFPRLLSLCFCSFEDKLGLMVWFWDWVWGVVDNKNWNCWLELEMKCCELNC